LKNEDKKKSWKAKAVFILYYSRSPCPYSILRRLAVALYIMDVMRASLQEGNVNKGKPRLQKVPCPPASCERA